LEVPGGTVLCQVSETISCGACCGLYNAPDPTFDSLMTRLAHRTEVFSRTPRDWSSIESARDDILSTEPGDRPLPHFHHCPFLGLVGPEKTAVGCLLHPLAPGNHGVDFRGLSHYGGMACKICFCPAHRLLPIRYKEALRRTAPDWHAYGIVLTECRALSLLFEEAEAIAGAPISGESAAGGEKSVGAFRALYELIVSWPFRRAGYPLGTYFLGDGFLRKDPVDYRKTGRATSRHDAVFLELASQFSGRDELARAERAVDKALEGLASTLNRD